jgi:phosphatidylglycerophosphate synthase
MKNKKSSYKDSLKSPDTEETFDLIFNRPIGYAWALLFRKIGITPNMVTIAAIVIGSVAGVLFYFNDLQTNIVGMLLLIWANTFDSADGQLARLTNNKSRTGRILDGLCGDIWFVIIYVALCIRMQHLQGLGEWVWLLGIAAGISHTLQAAMADYYRQIHLYFINGRGGSEVESSELLKVEYKKLKWGKNFFRKFVLFNYLGYTQRQEGFTKNLQKLLKIVHERYGEQIPESFATEFRIKNKPLMKYTNILTFNTRVAVLFISLFCLPWIYFVFELTVLNAILIYMVWKQERISSYFYNKLGNGDISGK